MSVYQEPVGRRGLFSSLGAVPMLVVLGFGSELLFSFIGSKATFLVFSRNQPTLPCTIVAADDRLGLE